jgi:hypothetical protein
MNHFIQLDHYNFQKKILMQIELWDSRLKTDLELNDFQHLGQIYHQEKFTILTI